VRVRIRKVAHINGVSPYARSSICILGYAYVAWRCCSALWQSVQGVRPRTVGRATPWATSACRGGRTKPTPGQSSNTVASTAIKMVATASGDDGKAVRPRRQMDGGRSEGVSLAQYSAEIGARLASDPWSSSSHWQDEEGWCVTMPNNPLKSRLPQPNKSSAGRRALGSGRRKCRRGLGADGRIRVVHGLVVCG
jgi:hypothetical protein